MSLQVIINFFLLVTLIAMIVINMLLLLKRRRSVIETKYHSVLEKLNKDLQKHVDEISKKAKEHSTLCSVSEKINLSLNLEETLNYIAKMATEITNTESCSLRLLDDENKNKLLIRAAHNLSDKYMKKGPLEMGEGVGGYVAEHAEPVAISDIRKDKRVDYNEFLKNEGLIALLSVPIKSKIRVIGLISVYKKSPHEFEQNDIDLLSAFANHVSVAIENAKLYDTIKKNYLETIETLALTIEARDLYTRGHSERVTNYAIGIAKELGVEEELLEIIRYAGRLHDIGKIAIPDGILNKPGKLTTAEFAEIKTHPTKGAELVEPLEFLKNAAPMIKHHHERFDGRGYPDGLEKMDIPLIARILAVADSFDAMTSKRPYRQKPMNEDEAIEELKKNKGTQFDPQAVDAFIKVIKQR